MFGLCGETPPLKHEDRTFMQRTTAYNLLGTADRAEIAKLLDLSLSSVEKWPQELPRVAADRVLAYCTRRDWTDVRNRLARHERRMLHPMFDDALVAGS